MSEAPELQGPPAADPAGVPATGNVFDPAFLARLRDRDEPATANEAHFNDRWSVVSAPGGGWAVLREWESLARGDAPQLVARRRETALLACAVLPGLGREPLFHLDAQPGPEGYALRALLAGGGYQEVARLRRFDAGLAAALHTSEAAVRSAHALACVLEAAGFTTLELSGRLLYRRLAG